MAWKLWLCFELKGRGKSALELMLLETQFYGKNARSSSGFTFMPKDIQPEILNEFYSVTYYHQSFTLKNQFVF